MANAIIRTDLKMQGPTHIAIFSLPQTATETQLQTLHKQ